jgi:hypothetical protein
MDWLKTKSLGKLYFPSFKLLDIGDVSISLVFLVLYRIRDVRKDNLLFVAGAFCCTPMHISHTSSVNVSPYF